jgi:hypothetical protein
MDTVILLRSCPLPVAAMSKPLIVSNMVRMEILIIHLLNVSRRRMGAGRCISLHSGAMKLLFSTYKFIALVSLIIHEKGLFNANRSRCQVAIGAALCFFVTISRMQECTDGS